MKQFSAGVGLLLPERRMSPPWTQGSPVPLFLGRKHISAPRGSESHTSQKLRLEN